MTDKQARLQHRLAPEITEFRQQQRTLMLATSDDSGQANVSYAPFVESDGCFYVLISEIARHARNMECESRVSVMLIEDEQQAKQIFARKRLSYDAQATVVSRSAEQWQAIIDMLAARHGELVHNLTHMADFKLFELTPTQGLYVKGFGQAFSVQGMGEIVPLHLDKGHQPLPGEAELKVPELE